MAATSRIFFGRVGIELLRTIGLGQPFLLGDEVVQ